MVNQALVAATLTTAPAFGVTARAPLFEGFSLGVPAGTGSANFDLSPDGTQFLVVQPVGGNSQIIVVHDWRYELRERTAAKSAK